MADPDRDGDGDPGAPAVPSRGALAQGTALGAYRVRRVFRRTSREIVYVAADPKQQRRVLIREYFPQALAERDAEGRVVPVDSSARAAYDAGLTEFLDEGRRRSEIEHPALVRSRGTFKANGSAYLVLAFPKTPTLEQTRKDLGHPPAEAWLRERLLAPVLSALEQLHGAGIVHGDLQPAHVLMLPDERTVLLDPVSDGRVPRDPADLDPSAQPYAAPEAAEAGCAGPAADVYGLAALTCFAITGSAPPTAAQRRAHALARASDAMRETISREPGLVYAENMLATLDAAFAADPAERLPDVAAFRSALQEQAPRPRVVATADLPAAPTIASAPAVAATPAAEPAQTAAPVVSEEAPDPVVVAPPGIAPAGVVPSTDRLPDPARVPRLDETVPVVPGGPTVLPAPDQPLPIAPAGGETDEPEIRFTTALPIDDGPRIGPLPAAVVRAAESRDEGPTVSGLAREPAAAPAEPPRAPIVPPMDAPVIAPVIAPAASPRPDAPPPAEPAAAVAAIAASAAEAIVEPPPSPSEPPPAAAPPSGPPGMLPPPTPTASRTGGRWIAAAAVSALLAFAAWHTFGPRPAGPAEPAARAPAADPAASDAPAAAASDAVSTLTTAATDLPAAPATPAPASAAPANPQTVPADGPAAAVQPPAATLEASAPTGAGSPPAEPVTAARPQEDRPATVAAPANPPRTAATPAVPAAAAAIGDSPRAVCGARTNFALYYCMQKQCKESRWFTHPQCKRLRDEDVVD